ncbi:MAG TPA: YdcF family protein [Sporosarcina psychrophila]|uniref:YdcF family protein n=1 Tax=Sporosarcina psychrophila TaxID=1476 RepID=A0A921KE33_SPOPS|nr:YdcF family protein [Sporosarcina psychrophila]
MKKSKKVAVFFIIAIAVSGIFLWWLTGKWMDEGLEPSADGTNDYAIVLGAKVKREAPSLSLQYRLDAALRYANEHPHVKMILSGGQGPDEHISEAEAMRQFLTENGVASERLILETASTSTYENILFSKKLMPTEIRSVTIITSDYHLARARKIAASLNLESDAVAAVTPKIVAVKLTMRERIALVKTYILGK